MSRFSDVLYRQTNLTFALLDSRKPRSREWIRTHVDGYQHLSDKQLLRDLKEIRAIGVPVSINRGMVEVHADDYELEPIELTQEEAAVVAMAGTLGHDGQLGAFARTGWTKLAASGASISTSFPGTSEAEGVVRTEANDINRLSPDVVAHIMEAVQSRRAVTFEYSPNPTADPATRRMDPWGLVPENGRIYLTGFDLDREAPRSFRIVRVSNVTLVGPRTHEPDDDLQNIVREAIRASQKSMTAMVTVTGRNPARLEPGVRQLDNVDADWLVRTAASSPHVTVTAPEEIRDRVRALLEEAVANHE